jgi:hypothetical protein
MSSTLNKLLKFKKMDLLNDSYLHQNYLKILKFFDPSTAIKEWVKEDTTQYGDYHKEYDWIMPLVEKIESYSTRTTPIDFMIGNGLVEVTIYKSVHKLERLFHYRNLYAEEGHSKVFATYKGVCAFIDWFNSNVSIIMDSSAMYVSPYTLYNKHNMKDNLRIFRDSMSIEHLVSVIANSFNTEPKHIFSKTRKQNVVKARQLAMAMISCDGSTLSEAGMIFKKDHATVLHAKKAMLDIIDTKDYKFYQPVMEVLEIYDFIDKFQKWER